MREKVKDSKKRSVRIMVLLVIFNVVLIGLCGGLLVQAGKVAVAEAEEAYASRFEEVAENTAQEYYEWAFRKAEEEYHVSNRATLSIGDIQERSRLEVLNVSDVEFIVYDEDEDTSKRWVAIPGDGVFTVDMTESEFLIDEVRQTIVARLPRPRLTSDSVKVKSENIVIYNFEKGILKNGNYADGISYAEKDLREGQEMIRSAFLSNQEYLKSAEQSAKRIITEFIHNLNPKVTDLKVVVEFMD